MASPSPFSLTAASVSRSKMAKEEPRGTANEASSGDPRSALSMPPSPSVSRSGTSKTETTSTADERLRASLSGRDLPPASSASMSRSTLRGGKSPLDDDAPRASVPRTALSSATPASISKSTLRGGKKSTADATPGASLVGNTTSSASPASVSKSSLRGEAKPSRDGTLKGSLAAARGMPSEFASTVHTSPPPLYTSKLSVRPKATSLTAGRSRIVDSLKLLELRRAKLKEEIDTANSITAPRKTAGMFRKACSTDLLFLIDTTGSMGAYIEAAKNQVRSIVSDIKKIFLNESQVRIAVVSYKDHGDYPNVEFLDFTTSADTVRSFLDRLDADGGADMPEDVLGGIQKALEASWSQQTRCVIHIADAPPHGSSNHDFGPSSDSYHTEGSEPHGLTYQPLFKRLVQLRINYVLLCINYSTDRMALNFADIYGYDYANLLTTNKYYEQVSRSKAGRSTTRTPLQAVQPQFEEQALGTSYDKLRHLVVNSVTASVSRTAESLTLSLAKEAAATKPKLASALSAIRESDESYSFSGTRESLSQSKSTSLETTPPRWDTPGWLDETLEVEGFCPAIVVHDADTLSDMMFEDEKIKLSDIDLTVYARSKPFAEGSVRQAYYARSAASTNRFVVKSFIRGGHTRAHVTEDMRMQALCKAFALEFNGLLKIEPPLDFIVTSCLEKKGMAGECLSLEPYIEGEYIKYNSNGGYVNELFADDPFGQMAQAFSHFSFERSYGRFIVNDLQGVGRILTDPSIQTKDPERFKLNDTNLNEEGFKFFFSTHKCNTYCEQLELQTNGEMLVSRTLTFRERWPVMDPTVCCSNKLCRRIIRLATAHSSDDFAGHHWCDICWPQLQHSSTKSLCVEPGENHDFDVSRFFHESQGEITPQKCPDHREKNLRESSAAMVGVSFYSKMKATESTGSIAGSSW